MKYEFLFNSKYLGLVKLLLSDFKKSKIKYVLLSGGRGSGKTTVVNTLLLFRVLKNLNENIIYSRYTNVSLSHTIKDLTDKINTLNLPIEKRNDSRLTKLIYKNTNVIFSGLFTSNKNQSLKSIPNSSLFIVEEASSIKNSDEFDGVHKSLRHQKLNNMSILIFNPTNSSSFIYQRFFNNLNKEIRTIEFMGKKYEYEHIIDEQVLHIHTTFIDNLIHLPKDFIYEAISTSKNNDLLFKRDYLGIFTDVFENSVFKNVEYCDSSFDVSLPTVIGVDFGFKDFTAFTKVSLDIKNKICYLELLFYDNNLGITKLKELFHNFYHKYHLTFVCDTNLKHLTSEIGVQYPNSIRYKDSKTSIYEQLVKISQFKIVTNSKKAYSDLITYKQVTNNVFSNDYGNHITDSFRYGCWFLIKSIGSKILMDIF